MELINVLHYYLGCEVMLQLQHDKPAWRDIMTTEYLHRYGGREDWMKPILRPLSALTDEEFKEAVLLHWGVSRDIIEQLVKTIKRNPEVKQYAKYGTAIPYSAFKENGDHYMTGTLSTNSLNPETFNYLLKLGVDLFHLIESGQAIDRTKMK